MNETKLKILHRTLNIIVLIMILMIVLNVNSCADNMTVTNYDGFIHECEKAGGIVKDQLCWDTSVLVNMEGNTKPVIHIDLSNTVKEDQQ